MGKFTEYKLPLKSLPEGSHEFSYRLGKTFFTNMENTDVHDADLLVTLQVTHKADLYDLDFHIEGTVTLICDRCLDNLEIPVDTSYRIGVRYGDDYDDSSDDLLIIPMSDNYLNVAYMIYDTAVLAIPMRHVHPLGKCNRQMSAMLKKHRARTADDIDEALEEMSEATDDTDPRWDALKNLPTETEQ